MTYSKQTPAHAASTFARPGFLGLLRRFIRDERGTASLEFLVWVPAFFFMLMIFTDVSLFFLSRTAMADVTREAAREVSIGAIAAADVPGYVEERIQIGGRRFWVDVRTANDEVTVDLDVMISETTLFGIVRLLSGDVMSVRASVQMEPLPDEDELGIPAI